MIGEIITRLGINPSKNGLAFHTDKGSYVLCVNGDCCSQSWIEHIEGVEDCIGATIVDVDDIEMEDDWCGGYPDQYKAVWVRPDEELIRYYCTRIITDKGPLKIEYRNSSNGYYGATFNIIKPGDDVPDDFKGELEFTKLDKSF